MQNKISCSISKDLKIHLQFHNKFKFEQMPETNHLCDLWEHTIAEVFKHDTKSEL